MPDPPGAVGTAESASAFTWSTRRAVLPRAEPTNKHRQSMQARFPSEIHAITRTAPRDIATLATPRLAIAPEHSENCRRRIGTRALRPALFSKVPQSYWRRSLSRPKRANGPCRPVESRNARAGDRWLAYALAASGEVIALTRSRTRLISSGSCLQARSSSPVTTGRNGPSFVARYAAG